MQHTIGAMTKIVVRKAVDRAVMAVRKAELITPKAMRKAVGVAIVAVRTAVISDRPKLRKAVEVAIVAVRTAVINDRTKFTAIKHPRPGTKYRQTRQKV